MPAIRMMHSLGGGGLLPRDLGKPSSTDVKQVKLLLTCNAATYRFRDICGQMAKIQPQNFGFWEITGAPPSKWQKICPGPICVIMQNFTPIDATVAEISVTGQRKNSNHYTNGE